MTTEPLLSKEIWIARCGGHLLALGASADLDGSDRIAGNLWEFERWRVQEPTLAAETWMAEFESLQAHLAAFGVSAWGQI